MDENYKQMMRQNLKLAGMSDEQIEATLAMQETAMQAANVNMSFLQQGMQDAFAEMTDGNDSYFEFSGNPSINKSYQWAVACGADLIYLRADIINDLTTGTDDETCRYTLSEQWGINTHEEFIEMADSLLSGRHSKIYNKLAKGEDIPDYEEEKENMKEALETFKSNGLLSKAPNMLIWDLGRLINISRFAFDAGLLDRETALSYIKEASLQVKKNYKSWRDLSLGYQFGRAVWGGLEAYEELQEGMEQLLTEEDSPWVTLPFDMPLNFEE